MDLKPKLLVIAGPNGSGKTTFTRELLGHHWSEDCFFINPDEIANNEFGDWNSEEAIRKAMDRAALYRHSCLAEKRNMVLETVLSTDEKIDFIREAKDAGFFVRIFFVGTDNPKINAERIAIRVMNGGHDVPIPKIIKRYFLSITRGVYAAAIADRAYVYDNSVDNSLPRLLFRTKDGMIFKKYPGLEEHFWARDMMEELGEIRKIKEEQ